MCLKKYAREAAGTVPDLEAIAHELCGADSLRTVLHESLRGTPMPSLETLAEVLSRLKAVIFPGYFGASGLPMDSLKYHLTANLDSIYHLLAEEIRRGSCFACAVGGSHCNDCGSASGETAMKFLRRLPRIRHLLASDARAAYEGDPAATSPGEAIFCYPSMLAMTHHRIAHELYTLGVPLIPRIITEMAHSRTGIDIHPGASIGEDFFIDHGTGVVIGETAVIGRGCRLYQGVTLGALSFPKDENGILAKGIARHPVLEDNVTVYAGATILGRVTIGRGAIIGGNVWINEDVPAGARRVQSAATRASDTGLVGSRGEPREEQGKEA